ncbi:MAG: hypothetical protein ACSLEW_04805 [Nocardioides sp.]
MSIAGQLGLGSTDTPSYVRALEWWQHELGDDPALDIVGDLVDLELWTRCATRPGCDALEGWLAGRAVTEVDAATVLAWLLIPGAARMADRLRDLSPEIDQFVAGQLWLEVRTHGGQPTKAVGFTILQRTRRAVLADFGLGDGGERQDTAWANAIVTDRFDEHDVPVTLAAYDSRDEVCVLISRMLRDGALTPDDVGILASAAEHANWLDAPLRSRGGLTTPDALEVLTWLEPSKARTMRRRVGDLLKRVAVYAHQHGTWVDDEDLAEAHQEGWTLIELSTIASDPAKERMLRRWREDLDLIARCQALRRAGQAAGEPRCPCGGTGECDSWLGSA